MENDNFRSDYERLKHKFNALKKEHKELKEDYDSAEHYNDYLRKKFNEYQLMLSYALEKNIKGKVGTNHENK